MKPALASFWNLLVKFLSMTKGKVTMVLSVAKEEETIFGPFGISVTLGIYFFG